MVKVLSCSLEQYFAPFAVLLAEGSCETGLLDIYLNTFFGVRKFKNTSTMRIMLSLKMFKIESKFRK